MWNYFEEFLKPWFISINDLLTFPICITKFYTSMFWSNDYVRIVFQSILIIEQESLKGSRDLSRNKNMYGEPKEHDYLNFLLVRDLTSWAHHKGRDDQDKLATWHEMIWRTPSPILKFYRMQNQVGW